MAYGSLQQFLFSLLFLYSIAAPVTLGRVFHSHKSSQLLFPAHLEGSRKGDKLEGIHKLKLYLQRYGYLSDVETQTANGGEKDTFDEQLESAIKIYQRNFNLNVSGVVDLGTLTEMSKSRCGFADIINGTTRMRSGSHIHLDYRFIGPGYVWPNSKSHLTYTLINNFPSKFTAAVASAFDAWSVVSKFTFSQSDDGVIGDVKVSFEIGDHGDGHPFAISSSKVLAHAFPPTDGRLHFNDAMLWIWGSSFHSYDVQTVAVHELGHVLGLHHSSDVDAIMYPTVDEGTVKEITRDDIDGIRALYKTPTL